MSCPLLERLKSDEFAAAVGVLVPSPALRRILRRMKEVQDIVEALETGAITEDTIRWFVSDCTADLRRGKLFPHDLALAALGPALERRPTAFAEEYFRDLARLKLAEMPTSIRIARECLKHRAALPDNQVRDYNFDPKMRNAAYSPASDLEPHGHANGTKVAEYSFAKVA